MPASNTHECFRAFIGQKVVGCLFNALPPGRKDIAAGTKTLVFEDGCGLTITQDGAFWVDSVEDVKRAIRQAREKLENTQRELAGVLDLAGAA